MLALVAGCTAETAERPPGVRAIAYVFDGSTEDADEVTGPALAGLRLAALGSGEAEIELVDIGDQGSAVDELRGLGDDRRVVAAVVAPWTPATEATVAALGGAGLPVFSFSWAWGPPEHPVAPWRSIVLDGGGEAELLVGAAERAGGGETVCVAADPLPMSGSLARLAAAMTASRMPIVDAGVVDPDRPATASAVAGRIDRAGCAAVLWTGGVDGAALLLGSSPPIHTLVGTSRIKTDDGLALPQGGIAVVATCGCVDVNLFLQDATERFVHDFQAEGAAAPGPFAVEAHDVGTAIVSTLSRTLTRAQVATAIGELDPIDGLVGAITFGPGERRDRREIPQGWWRASGSRWLPMLSAAA